MLKKYKEFKKTMLILLFFMAINISALALVINTYKTFALVVFVSLFGTGYYPLISTTYELACEIAFPVSEGSA
jgi:hypothetical protein